MNADKSLLISFAHHVTSLSFLFECDYLQAFDVCLKQLLEIICLDISALQGC